MPQDVFRVDAELLDDARDSANICCRWAAEALVQVAFETPPCLLKAILGWAGDDQYGLLSWLGLCLRTIQASMILG